MLNKLPEYAFTASKDGVKASVKIGEFVKIDWSATPAGVIVSQSYGKPETNKA